MGQHFPHSPAEVASRNWRRRFAHAKATEGRFLDALSAMLGVSLERAAELSTAVVCALEQHLVPDERRDLEAQLPLRLRERVRACSLHAGAPAQRFGREGLLERVRWHLGTQGAHAEPPSSEAAVPSFEEAERMVRAVLSVLGRTVSPGERADVLAELPQDVRELWPPSV